MSDQADGLRQLVRASGRTASADRRRAAPADARPPRGPGRWS